MILYKYLSPERIDVLANCKFRYSQPGALNDPFEVKLSFGKLASDSEAINLFNEKFPVELEEFYKSHPRELRRKLSFKEFQKKSQYLIPAALAQYMKNLDELTPVVREQATQFMDENIGIFSLTQTSINKLMWSHYADSHKGFIIGFDVTHPYFNQKKSDVDEFGYLRKVEYRNNRPSLPMVEHEGTDVLLIKSREWEYEEEWRIIRPLREADEVRDFKPYSIYLFNFPTDTIREVILGCKMSGDKKNELIGLIKLKFDDVSIYQAELNVQDYNIGLSRVY